MFMTFNGSGVFMTFNGIGVFMSFSNKHTSYSVIFDI